MSSTVMTTFVLTGPYAGKTIALGSLPYPFVNGELTITAPADQIALHARFLERNWEAYPVGHIALEVLNGKRKIDEDECGEVPGDLQPDGSGVADGVAPNDGPGTTEPETGEGEDALGDGQPEVVTEPVAAVNVKLQKAIAQLDPADDTHWTKDGKPAMVAVEKLYGSSGITRQDVEAAAPGLLRESVAG